MSVRVSTSSLPSRACSGLMYSGVPMIWPSSVKNVFSVRGCVAAFAMPKSMIFGTGTPSLTATSTLDGLMSRWMIAFWWAWCSPSQTCASSSSRSRVVRWCRSQYSVIGIPRTYSITKYGRPSSIVPASSARAMLRWSIIASALRSDSKRARTASVSRPGRMSFSATVRSIGSLCSAR